MCVWIFIKLVNYLILWYGLFVFHFHLVLPSVAIVSFFLFLSESFQSINSGFFVFGLDFNWIPAMFVHFFSGEWIKFWEYFVDIRIGQLVSWWQIDELIVLGLGFRSSGVKGGANKGKLWNFECKKWENFLKILSENK